MEQVVAHLVGDYLLQSRWMAFGKVKTIWPAIVHSFVYTLPFLLITRSISALLVISLTHVLIDRYRLAKVVMWFNDYLGPKRRRLTLKEFRNVEKLDDTPPHVFFWLMVIVDNSMHVTINFFALKYFA